MYGATQHDVNLKPTMECTCYTSSYHKTKPGSTCTFHHEESCGLHHKSCFL